MTLSVFDQFYNIGIIPVLEIDSLKHAVPLAESSMEGGLPITEVSNALAEAVNPAVSEVGKLFVYFVSFVVKEF